jgi:hypothetical protein
MTARTKSTLILLATLVLGLVLGSLITGAVANRRLDRISEMRTARGMAFFLERAVQPETEEQRVAIRAVLDSAAPAFTEEIRASRERMRTLSDSLRAALEPLLTDAQKARLEEGMRVRRGGPPFGPRGDRPPPGEEPRRLRPDGHGGPQDGWREGRPAPADGAGTDEVPPRPPSG